MSSRRRLALPRVSEDPARPLTGQRYLVCNWRDSSHPRSGGAEVYCEQIARQLASQGADVVFLTSRPVGAARRDRVDFGEIVRLGGTLTTYPLALAWLAWHRRRIDGIIDSENGIPYFSPLAARRDTPIILLIHHVHQDQFAVYLPRGLRAVARWLERTGTSWVYGRRPVCAVSPSTRAAIRRSLRIRGRVYIAPNGVCVPDPLDTARTDRSPVPRVICVGRLVRHKRLDLLIRIVPQLREVFPELQVDIVGDGPDRPRLVRQTEELGLKSTVRFLGRIDDATRDRMLASAWLTVNPSAGEGWALSVMEAAAVGVPTVAMCVPGLQDSVRHGETGWLCDAPESLALIVARALEMLRDPEEADRWSLQCQQWAVRFSWERAAALIRSILSSETERLSNRYDDRRRRNDAATIVALNPGFASAEVIMRLRRTDQVRIHAGRVELLLPNADELDAGIALARIGMPAAAVADIRIARPVDLLGWEVVGRAELVIAAERSIGEVTLSESGPAPVIALGSGALVAE